MSWTHHHEVLPGSGRWADLDRLRAFRASVLEDDDGTLRMWYSGHDGSTGRILEAVQPPGQPWRRVGVSLDAGAAGETDAYGVEAPSVVRTPVGFLMAYAGSDGADTRLHMASSADGHGWQPLGTFLQRGAPDAVGATHPCLVATGPRWWLFYAGYDGTDNGRRAAILAAVSTDGASWDRIGPVVEPDEGEVALTEPWVLLRQRHFAMFFVRGDGTGTSIGVATSDDGVSWVRRGTTLGAADAGGDGEQVRSPSALHLHDGRTRLWYAARMRDDEVDGCRLWAADLADTEP